MSDIHVEQISADSLEGYHRALDAVARERRFLTMLEAPPMPATRDFVFGMIRAGNPHVVALSGHEVVGWCDISRHHWPSHAHRGTLGMGVVPDYRGRGIGRLLIEEALRRAWACGLTRVELNVHSDNVPAIALYDKTGFMREGVQRHASLIDGIYRDAIAMALVR